MLKRERPLVGPGEIQHLHNEQFVEWLRNHVSAEETHICVCVCLYVYILVTVWFFLNKFTDVISSNT